MGPGAARRRTALRRRWWYYLLRPDYAGVDGVQQSALRLISLVGRGHDLGGVPAGLVQQHDRMRARRHVATDLVEMLLQARLRTWKSGEYRFKPAACREIMQRISASAT